MRVKICGITKIDQGQNIAALGVHSLGFICVSQSPRYVLPQTISKISEHLPPETVRVGVFANHSVTEIIEVITLANLNAIQLHGEESPEFCQQLRQEITSNIELIKAFRVKSLVTLEATKNYVDFVDTLLLDAYHPQALGGTGQTINWQDLVSFQPQLPWLLAGGLTPHNILEALSKLQPTGIDLSSGVELAPGNKDLEKVRQLMATINNY